MQRATGFLTVNQRRIAWVGFILAAAQAPVSAAFSPDASWLFAVVVSMLVAVVLIADDAERGRARATPIQGEEIQD